MKFTTSVKMLPIVLGLGANLNVNQSTDLAFNENQIKSNLIEIDKTTYNYMTSLKEIVNDRIYMRERLDSLYKRWTTETMFLSRTDSIINNKQFQNIVSLGNEVVPFILEKLNNEPSQLVWALNLIMDAKISRNDLTISEASRAWVKWGLKNNVINQADLKMFS